MLHKVLAEWRCGGYYPLYQKKMDLLSYMLDVYIESENKEKCRELVAQIDAMNAQYKEYGIKIDISDEVRNAIQ